LRDDGNDFCADCTPEGKAKSAGKLSIRVEVKPVGDLAGYRILDVMYSVNGGGVTWKSILVQTGADSYREIFHLQATYIENSLAPSRIVRSGNEGVLVTMDRDGGNGGGCWEGYWWFDSSGPHALDFSRLLPAISKYTPPNTSVNISCMNLDLGSEQVRSPVQSSDARCRACDIQGQVTARFRLKGPVAEPVSVIFKPFDSPR
jgi:hypothetical protein